MNAFSSRTAIHSNREDGLGMRESRVSSPLMRQNRNRTLLPSALVLTEDESIRAAVQEVLFFCGVRPIFASTIEHAAHHLDDSGLTFCICEDRLPDGVFPDLLLLKQVAGNSGPLIVISRTGDWPEYLKATELGAYDYLGYPLIAGELERVILGFLGRPAACTPALSPFDR
jgi:DNA-binding NtrC family response regulator